MGKKSQQGVGDTWDRGEGGGGSPIYETNSKKNPFCLKGGFPKSQHGIYLKKKGGSQSFDEE